METFYRELADQVERWDEKVIDDYVQRTRQPEPCGVHWEVDVDCEPCAAIRETGSYTK